MTESKASYRQIMKATSIFGGVQVFNIIVSIIRSKFVAVLLGPEGMGIYGLYYSTSQFIGNIANLGLNTSAVKNIAAADNNEDSSRVEIVVSVLKRLVWVTGIAGTLITLILAPWLSELTFGTRDYSAGFRLIAITLLLTQISTGQLIVLQGLRKLQLLAKANLTGTASALLISIPVYYLWRLDGIVPAIIISAFMTLLFSWFYVAKLRIKNVSIKKEVLVSEGGDMIKVGFILSVNSLISVGTGYLMRIYISRKGGVDQVGLFNAGFAIINTYVGMVFTAMVTDYFPRLSGIAHDNAKAADTINHQAEIALLILAPILTVFLVFVNFIVILFYSNKFIAVDSMIHWAALGIFFKAASWPIAYVFVAKGDSKIFFYSEFAANVYMLIFNILGYMMLGLEGLGISFFAGYLVYLVQVFLLARLKYNFTFGRSFQKMFLVQFIIGSLCFLISKFLGISYIYIFGSLLIIISSIYSFLELNKRIDLKALIENRLNRKTTIQ